MTGFHRFYRAALQGALLGLVLACRAFPQATDVQQLVAAFLKETPITEDLRELTDEIGGRPTGSQANLKSVDWALQKFKQAGVTAWKEAFRMPEFWLEKSASARVTGDVSFAPRVVSMPFSTATPAGGLTAPLVDAGFGTAKDFERLGPQAKGAFVVVATHELKDIEGLFAEYAAAPGIESRAFAAGAAGVVYMSSRPQGLLYRHNASLGPDNTHPLLVMEREEAGRILRLLRHGKKLALTANIDIDSRGAYDSYNVIGEIKGSERPREVVLIGAHLDSWGLGTGANDNGCNVAMMIDIARQMKKLGLRPKRSIRFVLWNGEEQGMIGSWRYTQKHASELDDHMMACSIDIGSGKILGFFTNGREDLLSLLSEALAPVQAFGPFENINMPIVGTDNYDFMMQGVPNLVANHDPANYGPNYHAESDTYDKVDLLQLKKNAAVVAAVTWAFAQMDLRLPRQSRADIQKLIDTTNLGNEMRSFNLMQSWLDGSRGRTQ